MTSTAPAPATAAVGLLRVADLRPLSPRAARQRARERGRVVRAAEREPVE